jgi:hypothetical protein
MIMTYHVQDVASGCAAHKVELGIRVGTTTTRARADVEGRREVVTQDGGARIQLAGWYSSPWLSLWTCLNVFSMLVMSTKVLGLK